MRAIQWRRNGAAREVRDCRAPDLVRRILALSGGPGVDRIIEPDCAADAAVAATFPLDRVAEAHAAQEAGVQGKVVVVV
jgi:hypothetical protein